MPTACGFLRSQRAPLDDCDDLDAIRRRREFELKLRRSSASSAGRVRPPNTTNVVLCSAANSIVGCNAAPFCSPCMYRTLAVSALAGGGTMPERVVCRAGRECNWSRERSRRLPRRCQSVDDPNSLVGEPNWAPNRLSTFAQFQSQRISFSAPARARLRANMSDTRRADFPGALDGTVRFTMAVVGTAWLCGAYV